MKTEKIPSFVLAFLWSFDPKKLDIIQHKKRIITNVLNWGTKKATDWIFSTYSKEDIKTVLKNPLPGEWNKKSFFYWTFLFDMNVPFPKGRKIL